MERYERLKKLKPELFKRLTGVKPHILEAMISDPLQGINQYILEQNHQHQFRKDHHLQVKER